MNKRLSILFVLVFISLSCAYAEQIDISQDVKNCILDNFDKFDFTKKTVIFYYDNETCSDCSAFGAEINKNIQLFQTTTCFSEVGPTLAICLNNYNSIQDVSSADLLNFAKECNEYEPEQRKLISIPRPGDDDGDNPIRIYEDTGEILGIEKTVYDIFGQNYDSVAQIQEEHNGDIALIIINAEEEAFERFKVQTMNDAKASTELEYQEKQKISDKLHNCSKTRDEIGSIFKQKTREIHSIEIINGKEVEINLTEETEKLRLQMFAEVEDCSVYEQQLNEFIQKRDAKYERIKNDPQGLNFSYSKQNESEINFLKQYSSSDKKIILHQLSSKEIMIEKIYNNKQNEKQNSAKQWIKDFLTKIFG